MNLDSITLINFRSIAPGYLFLDPHFNLLVGENGSGKTAWLEGIAVALGAWFHHLPQVRAADRRPVEDRDFMRVVRTLGEPSLEIADLVSVEATGTLTLDDDDGQALEFSWGRLARWRGRTRTYGDILGYSKEAFRRLGANEPVFLPVLSYYGSGRLWVQKQARAPVKKLESLLTGYEGCLDPASNHLRFEQWMAWREEIKLQGIALALSRGQTPDGIRDLLLDAVEQAVCGCVPGATRFYYSKVYQELRFRHQDGQEYPFHLLSDGYRALVGMVADIAWRAVRLNPQLGHDIGRARGVVLIDELDLHLHPRWQYQVVDWLRKIFPRIQFIATTHAPHVIASVPAHQIRVIHPGGEIGYVDRAFGLDANTVLRTIMGASERHPQMVDDLKEIEHLIAAQNLEQARQKLAEVQNKLGPHDPAVMGLDWEIRDQTLHPHSDDG